MSSGGQNMNSHQGSYQTSVTSQQSSYQSMNAHQQDAYQSMSAQPDPYQIMNTQQIT
jgi:poly(rC)-binding protein 2/3/4